MTDTLLAIDPGQVSGWSLWLVPDDLPMQRIEYGLVHNGRPGFLEWMADKLGPLRPDILVCEQWRTRDGAADITPVYIEGQLEAVCAALAMEITWQGTDMKAMCSDDTLRQHGLYIMPAEAKVDPAILHIDARDVNDSQRHALGWGKAHGHEPTVDLYWPEMTL
jgi:hypothetical protein